MRSRRTSAAPIWPCRWNGCGADRRRLQRIGLSATQRPIEKSRSFSWGERPCRESSIWAIGARWTSPSKYRRTNWELSPQMPSGAMCTIVWRSWSAHRSTLVFVNTRRLAERVSHYLESGCHLGEGWLPRTTEVCRGSPFVRGGSVKNGTVRVVVATASLELGIDVGTVDLVCQIGSPRSIAPVCSASAAPAMDPRHPQKGGSLPRREMN